MQNRTCAYTLLAVEMSSVVHSRAKRTAFAVTAPAHCMHLDFSQQITSAPTFKLYVAAGMLPSKVGIKFVLLAPVTTSRLQQPVLACFEML